MEHAIASTALSIEVCNNGSVVTRINTEMLALPDGRPAAKWGGLVFPLRDGNRIELTDQGTVPASCRLWVDPKAFWRFEGGDIGADGYVFFDGNDSDRARTARILVAAGAVVIRSGPNLSGTPGDWFIRVAGPSAEIESVLRDALGASASPEAASDMSAIRERLLVQALEEATAVRDRLREELRELTTRVAEAPTEGSVIATQRQNLDAMAARLAELEANARQIQDESLAPKRADVAASRLEAALTVMAAATLPRITFLASSVSFIAIELSDRSVIWRILADLDRQDRGQPNGWKRLGGHPGWWERHFSTGQDDQGRVYGKLSTDRSGWYILVSHKQDQASDLRRLD